MDQRAFKREKQMQILDGMKVHCVLRIGFQGSLGKFKEKNIVCVCVVGSGERGLQKNDRRGC